MNIGDWVRRQRRGVPHYVESIIANDVVTRCGRRMRDEPTADGPLLLDPLSARRCYLCESPAT